FPLVDKQQKRLYFFYIYKKGRLEFFFLKSASIFFLFSFVSVQIPQVAQNRPKASMVFLSLFFALKTRKKPVDTGFTALSSILSVHDVKL
ncbi:hypothetical protein OCV67_11650, partial [Porcipelethomonas ammoniilytica]|uniref:hypothetical protein n=1 Tax=Porcipelethomonas ammoniilytica TaxID=2981722 RepID=UPI0021D34C2B